MLSLAKDKFIDLMCTKTLVLGNYVILSMLLKLIIKYGKTNIEVEDFHRFMVL